MSFWFYFNATLELHLYFVAQLTFNYLFIILFRSCNCESDFNFASRMKITDGTKKFLLVHQFTVSVHTINSSWSQNLFSTFLCICPMATWSDLMAQTANKRKKKFQPRGFCNPCFTQNKNLPMLSRMVYFEITVVEGTALEFWIF